MSVIHSHEALFQWIEKNNYEVAGNLREQFHLDDEMTDDPQEFVTEIQVPIQAKIKGGK